MPSKKTFFATYKYACTTRVNVSQNIAKFSIVN